jgi:hypothetical protein
MIMAHKKRKKGHAKGKRRKGHARGKLKKRYGHSTVSSPIRMNVTGQLVLDPEKLEEAIEAAVETAAEESIPEVVEEAAEEHIPEVVEEAAEEAAEVLDLPEHY